MFVKGFHCNAFVLTLAFGDLLHNLPFLVRAGHGRLRWIQAGNTSHSISHCVALFHRLTDAHSLCLMMIFEDILTRVVGPFTSTVQLHLEPTALQSCMDTVLRQVSRFEKAIQRTRVLFRVIALCRQWVDEPMLRNFIIGYAYTPPGMLLPTLLKHAVTLLADARPTVNRVSIEALGASDPKVEMCLGPHCKCHSVHHHGVPYKATKVKWLQAVGSYFVGCESPRCFACNDPIVLIVSFEAGCC